jgi:hypothetical protein
MGTRHLTVVVVDGDVKVSQYGQWDGYPSGQGTTILDFLLNKGGLDVSFVEKVKKCRYLDDQEYKELWASCGADPEAEWVSMDVSSLFGSRYPWLSRNAGGEVLILINNSEDGLALKNSIAFAGDSLFCEWAYVVDYDKRTFEIYQGFNKTPLTEDDRFYGFPVEEDSDGYYPVKLLKSYSLDELPTFEDLEILERSTEESEEIEEGDIVTT